MFIKKNTNPWMVIAIFALVLQGLVACSETPQTDNNANSSAKNATDKKNQSAEGNSSNSVYAFDEWLKKPISTQGYNYADIASVIGNAKANENALDYYGNPATVHKYYINDVVFFNILDSESYIELNWFKASDEDSESIKSSANKIAKMAHESARVILNKEGASIIQDIMTNPDMPTQSNNESIVEAVCESFFCRVIISK